MLTTGNKALDVGRVWIALNIHQKRRRKKVGAALGLHK
jgi:hypothetical protein